MTNIIDRRKTDKGKATVNRKKFLDRYKKHVREGARKAVEHKSIKDIGTSEEIGISGKDLKEYGFEHDPSTGKRNIVLPGNKEFIRGDSIPRPPADEADSASPDGEGEDDFRFVLTKDEFLDIYFSDMELPNFVKESIKRDLNFTKKKAGYSKDGIPAKLNIKKTFEKSMARRISTKAQIKRLLEDNNLTLSERKRLEKKKPRYIDDEDIRYDYYEDVPKPIRQAVMFCLMDVSGSMNEFHKDIAKRFFILLYLFLEREYENIEIVFVRHTHHASEVDEEEFFHSTQSGGTQVSTAFSKAKEIVDDRFPLNEWNIYFCQASDGDNFTADNPRALDILENELLPICQYFAYIEVIHPDYVYFNREYCLLNQYRHIQKRIDHFNTESVHGPEDVYPVLRKLFKKE